MSDANRNQATRRALKLIMRLAGHSFEGVALKALSDALGETASTTLRDLQVLEAEGYAERVPGRETFWRLAPRIVQVAIAHQAEVARLQNSLATFENRYSRTPN
jgi:DNA-binding IclR family transcriptional regulator